MIVKYADSAQADVVRDLDGVLPSLRIQFAIAALPVLVIPARAILAVH